jgi:hypothetical protein
MTLRFCARTAAAASEARAHPDDFCPAVAQVRDGKSGSPSSHNTSCASALIWPHRWSFGETLCNGDRYSSGEETTARRARCTGVAVSKRARLADRGGGTVAARGARGLTGARIEGFCRRARPANPDGGGASRARDGVRPVRRARQETTPTPRGGVPALRLARRAAPERPLYTMRAGARCT